jgi:hypothetical protein
MAGPKEHYMVKNLVRALVSGREPATAMKGNNLMSTTRIVWTLLLTGTLALVATGTGAQSIAQPGQSQEQDSIDEQSRLGRPWGIVGSWFGTTGTGLKQLWTFHADGTVFRSVPGEVSIAPGRPPHTLTHGVWRYLGDGRFGVTMWDIFYDVNTGQLIQYTKVRLEITQRDDRDAASARARLDFLDAQGVVLRTITGTTSFVRIPFEPLE